MQTTSSTYNSIISGDHSFEVMLNISDPYDPEDTGTDYGMDKLFSLSTDSKIFANEREIGGVYSATCEFSLMYDPQSDSIPRMAKCTPYFRVTDGTNTSEWIKKGEFYLDTRKVTANGIGYNVFEGSCYDAMILANRQYDSSSIEWPATDIEVIADICDAIRVTQDPRNASIITEEHLLQIPTGEVAYRDYLSYIAVMYSGNWIISDDGQLRFVPIDTDLDNRDTLYLTASEVTSVEDAEPHDPYTSVEISTSEENTIVSGPALDNPLSVFCPFATQAIADAIYEDCASAWVYRPFEAMGVWANPAVEVGDLIDSDSLTIAGSVIYSRVITFNQGMTMELSAPNNQDVDHEFYYESPEERRYHNTVNNMYNEISSNSEGITLLSKVVQDGMRNLITNTQTPNVTSQEDWPRLIGQADNTRTSDWTVTEAAHGIRCRKGSSQQTNVAFVMGGTSPGSSTASMNGLEAGEAYTYSGRFAYHVLSSSSPDAFARWRLLTWSSNTSGATVRMTEIFRQSVMKASTQAMDMQFSFVIPSDAVVCALYFNFCEADGTNIPASQFRSTDYYEFAEMTLVKGWVGSDWVPSEDEIGGDGESLVSRINIAPGTISIDADKINLNGAVTANNNVQILTDGTIKAVNADISGKFTMTGGSINVTTGSGTTSVISLNTTQLHSVLGAGLIKFTEDSVSPAPETVLDAFGLTSKTTNGANDYDQVALTSTALTFTNENGTAFSYSATGFNLVELKGNLSELVSASSTAKIYEIADNGTYLLTVSRSNSTSNTYSGAWLVSINGNSNILPLATGSNAPSPTVGGNKVYLTTTSTNQRITITKLS